MAASQTDFALTSFPFIKKQYYAGYDQKRYNFYLQYLIFYHSEIVTLDHFIILSLSFANTVLLRSRCKIHRFVAAPLTERWKGGVCVLLG